MLLGAITGLLAAALGHVISSYYQANKLTKHRVQKARWRRERKQVKELLLCVQENLVISRTGMPTKSKGYKCMLSTQDKVDRMLENLYGAKKKKK